MQCCVRRGLARDGARHGLLVACWRARAKATDLVARIQATAGRLYCHIISWGPQFVWGGRASRQCEKRASAVAQCIGCTSSIL